MARIDATDALKMYQQAKTTRNPNESDWRLCSAYCLPRQYNSWGSEGPTVYNGNTTSAAKRVAYDTTGVLSLPKYMAVLERISTPHNMVWQALEASDKDLMKQRRVRAYFDELRNLLFSYRYNPNSRFIQAQGEGYGNLGCYGTAPKLISHRKPNALLREHSILYKSYSLRDIFILTNDEGDVEMVFRRFWLNCRQFKTKFPGVDMPKCFAAVSMAGADQQESKYEEFVHIVMARNDYDPEALDARRHPIVGSYLCVTDQAYVDEEHGFRSMPYIISRTFTESGNPYGFSPAMQALSSMGVASAIKKTTLKQGQKAADPVILTHDDGVMNGGVDLRPGAVNPGGVNKDGRLLINTLPTGNFQISDRLLESERADIRDSFFVTVFQKFIDKPEMTARQVMEMVAEQSAQLSPTMGRIQSEDLAPSTMREIDVLIEMGKIADGPNAPGLQMPPELIEARGEYNMVWTSPMAKGMYAEEVSGFMDSVDLALKIAEATGDSSHLDTFDFNVALPEIAYRRNVPERWLSSPEIKEAKAQSRQAAQQQQQLLENAAPLSAAAKNIAEVQQGAANG